MVAGHRPRTWRRHRQAPRHVGFDDYIGGGCGLLTAVHVLERAALRPGDSVLVQGAGAVGLSVVALARLSGASTIVLIGGPPERLTLGRAMGADALFDIAATCVEARAAAIRELTHDEGPDVAIETADPLEPSKKASRSSATAAAM